MRTTYFAAPLLAFALAAFPAVSLHAQQYGPPQDHDHDAAQRDSGQWDAPPSEFHDTERQGFHDGIEAARFDMENNRGMDPHRSRMFRHPPVSGEMRHEYREGFVQGYNVAMQHGHDRDRDHRDHDGDHHDDDHHDGPPQQPNS
jgi:hypothetical protein